MYDFRFSITNFVSFCAAISYLTVFSSLILFLPFSNILFQWLFLGGIRSPLQPSLSVSLIWSTTRSLMKFSLSSSWLYYWKVSGVQWRYKIVICLKTDRLKSWESNLLIDRSMYLTLNPVSLTVRQTMFEYMPWATSWSKILMHQTIVCENWVLFLYLESYCFCISPSSDLYTSRSSEYSTMWNWTNCWQRSGFPNSTTFNLPILVSIMNW